MTPSKLQRIAAPLNVCAVCERAFENRRGLADHIFNVHAVDSEKLKEKIQTPVAIMPEDRTDAQNFNLCRAKRKRAFLRRFRRAAI